MRRLVRGVGGVFDSGGESRMWKSEMVKSKSTSTSMLRKSRVGSIVIVSEVEDVEKADGSDRVVRRLRSVEVSQWHVFVACALDARCTRDVEPILASRRR